jgi:hypothetical protein
VRLPRRRFALFLICFVVKDNGEKSRLSLTLCFSYRELSVPPAERKYKRQLLRAAV